MAAGRLPTVDDYDFNMTIPHDVPEDTPADLIDELSHTVSVPSDIMLNWTDLNLGLRPQGMRG